MSEPILKVKGLKVHFPVSGGFLAKKQIVKAVDGVDFEIAEGETFGLVGESGCGKSMTALSLMQLIPSPPGKITSGEIIYKGEDLLKKSEREIQNIRGKEISMIFQEPMTSLNPVVTVGKQIMEAVLTHENISKEDAKKRALEMISLVGIPMPEKVFASCPHQLSGGMRQRVALIRTLAVKPKILLLDEAFSALDYQTRIMVTNDIYSILRKENITAIIVTHDISEAISMSDRVVVLTKRPGTVKDIHKIDFEIEDRNPINCRESPKFSKYFNTLWKELKNDE